MRAKGKVMVAGKLTAEDFYSEGLKSDRVLGLRCENGHYTAPPRYSCRVCRSRSLEVAPLSGAGVLVSFTEIYAKARDFPFPTPYMLALVRLDEGPNLLGVLLPGERENKHKVKVEAGLRVKSKFRRIAPGDAWPRIVFEPG